MQKILLLRKEKGKRKRESKKIGSEGGEKKNGRRKEAKEGRKVVKGGKKW